MTYHIWRFKSFKLEEKQQMHSLEPEKKKKQFHWFCLVSVRWRLPKVLELNYGES